MYTTNQLITLDGRDGRMGVALSFSQIWFGEGGLCTGWMLMNHLSNACFGAQSNSSSSSNVRPPITPLLWSRRVFACSTSMTDGCIQSKRVAYYIMSCHVHDHQVVLIFGLHPENIRSLHSADLISRQVVCTPTCLHDSYWRHVREGIATTLGLCL